MRRAFFALGKTSAYNDTHIARHFSKGRGRACPQHLPPGGSFHVPDGDFIVVADGRDEGGGLGGMGTQSIHMVDVDCVYAGGRGLQKGVSRTVEG